MAKKLEDMTPEERSLLLYVECCAVDEGGLVDSRKINSDERDILKRWHDEGLISFSRITWDSIQSLVNKHCTDLVYLSEEAWNLAHQERRARQVRMSRKPPYRDLITTKTKSADIYTQE